MSITMHDMMILALHSIDLLGRWVSAALRVSPWWTCWEKHVTYFIMLLKTSFTLEEVRRLDVTIYEMQARPPPSACTRARTHTHAPPPAHCTPTRAMHATHSKHARHPSTTCTPRTPHTPPTPRTPCASLHAPRTLRPSRHTPRPSS